MASTAARMSSRRLRTSSPASSSTVTALAPSAEVERIRLTPWMPSSCSSMRLVMEASTSAGDAPG
jgi:hypothetical protein